MIHPEACGVFHLKSKCFVLNQKSHLPWNESIYTFIYANVAILSFTFQFKDII